MRPVCYVRVVFWYVVSSLLMLFLIQKIIIFTTFETLTLVVLAGYLMVEAFFERKDGPRIFDDYLDKYDQEDKSANKL